MSVAVWYVTTKPVPRATADRLLAEAEALPPLVWYEPIQLTAEGEDSVIVKGWSKGPPMSVDLEDGTLISVPFSDWVFMDYWDFSTLVARLEELSEKCGVDWRLTAEGRRLGKVRKGRANWRLRGHLGSMAHLGGASADPDADERRAEELRCRYPALAATPAGEA